MSKTSQRGSTIVEAAFTLSTLLLLIIGALGFGVVSYDYEAMSDAAREGARYGVVAVNTPSFPQVAQRVCSFLSAGAAPGTCPTPSAKSVSPCVMSGGTVPAADDVYVTNCSVTQANNVTVSFTEVDVRKHVKLPLLPMISLHTTAAMRNEAN